MFNRFSVKIYQLITLTYGTGPAAAIATECLCKSGDEVQESLPEVTKAIKEEVWIDNVLSGAKTVEEAIKKGKTDTQNANEC